MNRLQLSALVLSVITEIKFGQPLARNAKGVKAMYKKLVGIPKNASNKTVLSHLAVTYWENGLINDFKKTMKKMFGGTSIFEVLDKDLINNLCNAIVMETGKAPIQEK